MKKKDFSAIIMLLAGVVAIISCIINQYSLLDTLKIMLVVLVIFYLIGVIIGKIVVKINNEAQIAYINAEREKMKEEHKEEQELVEHEEQE